MVINHTTIYSTAKFFYSKISEKYFMEKENLSLEQSINRLVTKQEIDPILSDVTNNPSKHRLGSKRAGKIKLDSKLISDFQNTLEAVEADNIFVNPPSRKPNWTPWSGYQNKLLMDAIEKYGTKSWIEVSDHVPGKSAEE